MNWKLKCLAFHVIRYAPRSLYSLLQKRATGRYFFTVADEELAAYGHHLRHFRGGRALEFGAGSNLLCPLLLSNAGASEVLALDLQRLGTVEQVNHVIRQLRERLSGEWPEITDLDSDLTAKYRIRYLAPADARSTLLPPGSVDFICSTSTLEHIPPEDIAAIIRECSRVLSPNGVMSHIIDYHDHYATADPSISRFNFYRYSERAWRIFNPPMHYQNRLRHTDYVRLFHGFEIEERAIIPDELVDVPLAREFQRYTQDDLRAKNGFFYIAFRA